MKSRGTEACTAAEQFAKIYYETYDKRRHVRTTIVWQSSTLPGKNHFSEFG